MDSTRSQAPTDKSELRSTPVTLTDTPWQHGFDFILACSLAARLKSSVCAARVPLRRVRHHLQQGGWNWSIDVIFPCA
jgi:hypothetical protein